MDRTRTPKPLMPKGAEAMIDDAGEAVEDAGEAVGETVGGANAALYDAVKVDGRSKAGKALDAVADFGDHKRLLLVNGAVLAAGLAARKPEIVRAGVRMFAAQGTALAARALVADRLHAAGVNTATEDAKGAESVREEAAGSIATGTSAATIAVTHAAARGNPMPFLPARVMGYAITGSNAPRKANFALDFLVGTLIGLAAEKASSALVDLAERKFVGTQPPSE